MRASIYQEQANDLSGTHASTLQERINDLSGTGEISESREMNESQSYFGALTCLTDS